jgi:hypothetical protein
MIWPPAPVPSSLSALGRATDSNSSPAGRTTHGSGSPTADASPRPAGQALGTPVGGTTLLSASEIRAELARAESQGLLPVLVASPGPAGRGRLALTLEAAIEEALLRRGACPPGIGTSASLEESLSDQLYRSRLIEMRGMALAVPPLEGIVSLGGALDPEDSAVLRWWLGVTRERPVWLLVDRSNTTLLVYGPPRAFYSWIGEPVGSGASAEAIPTMSPELASSSATMELSEPPPAVVEQDGALSFQAPLDDDEAVLEAPAARDREAQPSPIGDLAEAVLETLSAPSPDPGEVDAITEVPAQVGGREEPEPETQALPVRPLIASVELVITTKSQDIAERAESDVERAERIVERAERDVERAERIVERAERVIERDERDVEPAERDVQRDLAVEEAAVPATGPAPVLDVPPLYPKAKDEWPGWVRDLSNTRGPRPLAVIERTFVTSYVPLLSAVKQGIADAAAERALDVWAKNFAQSYREAFDALRVRGKRPAMVLDAPDIALRTARLHGARTIQLLLIDGMRFDLGLRIEQRVRALMGQRAALAERLLLWSALPSTTETQLELIGRGASGLSEPAKEPDSEILVARGRAAATPRRVKAGHRDLFKLDLVEARLSDPGPREPERLDTLADEVATAVAEFLGKQPARTLVLAFGDHGFCLDPREHGTAAARAGGASPEEVLVPAFAWLVGGLH